MNLLDRSIDRWFFCSENVSTSPMIMKLTVRKELVNKLVLTRYDNRTQRIDDIRFQLTPATCKVNEESQTTLVDYYLSVTPLALFLYLLIDDDFRSKFDIIIEDPDQPLIVYYPRRINDTNVGHQQPRWIYTLNWIFQIPKEQNYLVPELCYLTGLTDRAHRNARVMVQWCCGWRPITDDAILF